MSTTTVDPAYAAESNAPWILGVLTTFFVLAFTTVAARIYTRLRITRAAGADDILIGLAAVSHTTSPCSMSSSGQEEGGWD
jgi:hypothetical protein